MKVYITSIGEKTTDICVEQFKRYGYEVILLDKKESWIDKYKSFINTAEGDCLRTDADVIVNQNIKDINFCKDLEYDMVQFIFYDFYKNNLGIGTPMYYSKKAIDIIKNNLEKLHFTRPETSAWRLPEIVSNTFTSDKIVGMHGFFQDKETIERAKLNKEHRGQMKQYDFDLVFKLINL